MERQNADAVAEESFRSIKTILSLGAQKKFFSRYGKAVKYCYHRALRIVHVAALWFSLNLFTSQFADALMYLSAVVIVMGQRRSYPTELVEGGCIAPGLNSVDFCYSAANMTSACHAICDRVDSCWYDREGPCLVGGEVVVVMMAVLQAISGIGNAFTSIVQLAKARVAAAFFLEVIDHKDEMVDKKGEKPASNKGDIVFSDVSFKYKSRDAMILNHLNLTIHENEMVGIVGESGCGKSTILKLLMRLYWSVEWRDIVEWSERGGLVDGMDSRSDQLRGTRARVVQWNDSRESVVWSCGRERGRDGGGSEVGEGRWVHSSVPEGLRHVCW